MEESSQEFEQNEEDDLLDFQEYQQEQINLQVMKNAPGHKVEDDAEYIQGQQKAQKKQKKKQLITEEQRKARQLKLLNSRKYFEVAKLMYLQDVSFAIQETNHIIQNYKLIVAQWLTLLTPSFVEEFIRLKKSKPLSIQPLELFKLMKKIKLGVELKGEKKPDWTIIFWSVCQYLGIGCRKIHFFSIDSIVEEVFFQLKYLSSQLQRKKESKKSKQVQALKIQLSQIQQKIHEEQSSKFMDLQDFQFDETSFKSKQRKRLSEQTKVVDDQADLDRKRQNNFKRKKNYKNAYFQIFDPSSNEWILVNSEIFQAEDHQKSSKIFLQGKFVVGFYSTRILHFKDSFAPYSSLRKFKRLTVQDLTMYFEDNHRNLTSRRKRLGIKWIMKRIFEQTAMQKGLFMLTNYDSYLSEQNSQLELKYQLTIFPKTKEEMLTSSYFVINSLLPKYTILDENARPLPDLMFNEEAVFLRKDVIAVTSKLFWIDRGRRVKNGENPVKKTENKSKNLTQLYLYEQTIPFKLPIDEQTGDFIPDDEFNSVYVPTGFIPPIDMKIVDLKIAIVCNKAKIRYVKVVQGFSRSMGRILPNQIGFLIYEQNEPQILRLYEQRQLKLQQNKDKNKLKELIGMWNKLFKKIELSDWTRSFNERK